MFSIILCQPYSLTFIFSIQPPPSHNHLLPSKPQTYFTVLSFIFNYKVSVQRGFSLFPSYEYLYFGQFNPLCYSPLLFPSYSYYSTAFSTYPMSSCKCFKGKAEGSGKEMVGAI
jgi:hypothetical protein